MIEDVQAGKNFNDSLRDRMGGPCIELYEEWSQRM